MQANEDLNEQRATVDALFLSQSTFESELFMIADHSELADVFKNAAKSIIDRPSAQATVNFRTLTSYAQFRIGGCVIALKEAMNEEITCLIREEAGFSPIIVKEVQEDEQKQSFVLAQAKKYFIDYQSMFKEAIADSFFDRIVAAGEVVTIGRAIQEVIDGVDHYAPVLINSQTGASIVRKADQIWMRLKQAKQTKGKDINAALENVDRLTKKARGINNNIKAIEDAKALTLEAVQAMTLDELKEIVINEDGSRTDKKRIFQFVPAGEIAIYIAEQMDRGRRGGRNEIQKSEYKRATTFYENCNINNTEKELANKILMFNAELPKVEEALAKAEQKLATINNRTLDSFDDSLIKIRRAFVDNIGRMRV
ncbi:hypothetical protein AGMMS50229_16980 [Campylobacterota bacterium]|nr:hypothetical protein AGMMS50229_16980 [Campylobacterota bacterium]